MQRSRSSSAVLIVALVMAGACVAQSFGRFTYGVVLPAVRDDLLGSNGAAGLLGTVNVGAYLAGTVVVASVSTRVALITLIKVGLCLSTGGLLLASFATSAVVLGAALVAMGLGGAAIWIPSPRVASAALPPHRRGLAAGLVGMGIGIGIVFAGRLSDTLRHGQGDESWRDVYRVEALIGIGVLVAALVFLRPRAAAAGDDDRVVAPAVPRRVAPAAVASGSPSSGLGGFAVLNRIDGWLALTLAYAAFGFMYLLVFAFLVARLEDDAGFSADRASAMFSLVGVAAIFGGILLGPLSDRIGRRATMVGAFVAFGASVLVILPGEQTWVIVGAIGVGMSFSGLPAVIAAYVVDATDAATYGPAYSAATLAFGVAQMAAPQVGGLIADWRGSFTVVFVISAAVAAVGAVLSSRLPDTRRAQVPTVEPVL
ncbi:MAG: MFS transporter [Actinomycetota bacterium]|nr:MFS transporter [Actinomycetota bacterium]